MKIDTSTLTAVQAQQIGAITSDIAFNLRSHRGLKGDVTMSLTAGDTGSWYYDTLIADHQALKEGKP